MKHLVVDHQKIERNDIMLIRILWKLFPKTCQRFFKNGARSVIKKITYNSIQTFDIKTQEVIIKIPVNEAIDLYSPI